MTNAQMLKIYTDNLGSTHIAALRAVWNAGWHAAKGTTPTATSPDKSMRATVPTATVTVAKR